MAVLDFPDSTQSPFEAPNGVTYIWNNQGFWEAEGSDGYVLPVASNTVLGGIKVGSRLTITGDGTLSADAQGGGGTAVGSLQEVTDVGNTTTNGATFGNGNIELNADGTLQTRGPIYGTSQSGVHVFAREGGISNSRTLMNFRAGTGSSTDIATLRTNGSLLLGGTLPASPNISLDADGSASFAGTVRVGDPATNADPVSLVYDTGSFYARAANDSDVVFQANVGTAANTQIFGDGGIILGGTLPTSPNIRLNANGSASFAGFITATNNPDNGKNKGTAIENGLVSSCSDADLFNGWDLNTQTKTSTIGNDGSADFAGNVTVGGTTFFNGTASGNNQQAQLTNSDTTVDFYGSRDTSVNKTFNFYTNNQNSSKSVSFNDNGSAKFFGSIDSTGNLIGISSDATYALTTDYAYISKGGLVANHAVTDGAAVVSIYSGGVSGQDPKAVINADGSGEFAGTVTVNNLDIDALTTLP